MTDTYPESLTEVARAIDSLNNREAWRSICAWATQHAPRRTGAWRTITQAIWAERKRLRRRKRMVAHLASE